MKELLLLKDFVDEGADTSIVRPNRKYYDTLRELLFVSAFPLWLENNYSVDDKHIKGNLSLPPS